MFLPRYKRYIAEVANIFIRTNKTVALDKKTKKKKKFCV